MAAKITKISILGDGGWGTTLAIHLAKKKFPVLLWGPFPKYVQQVQKSRCNSKFLPGVRIPSGVTLLSDLKQTIEQGDLMILAVPSKYISNVLKRIKKDKIDLSSKPILSVIKGIDSKNLLLMSQLIQKELGQRKLAVLSGPTIAGELAQGIPSTAVIASKNKKLARTLQKIVNSENFRIYTNPDVIGVELGGSLKNIIAIACGVCDGLGFGTNTKAAILTRGLAEMARLGKALGAKPKTFAGLSGLGDLVTTCFSPKSRNRSVGEQLGKGKSIQEITAGMEMVAEGVETVKAACRLSEKLHVPMPIAREVWQIIYQGKNPAEAVADLMTRKIKAE